MDLTEIKTKLHKINELGFVKSHRSGNTGIGKTLEDLLDIKENNIPLHDIHGLAELKAYRKDATSMLTLFTIEPKPSGGDRDRLLLDNFGYSKRENNRKKELHSTLSSKRYNQQGLKLEVEKRYIKISSNKTDINIFWEMKDIEEKFNKKMPALIFVLAKRQYIKNIEFFYYNEAYFLKGFNFGAFKDMIINDYIVADLRMYYKPDGSVRNHGTAFRVKINKLFNCFDTKQKLL